MNSSEASSNVFESFNARNLSAPQVAKTFIPPPQFDDLVMRTHSLIVGPRGSGKTTLLKMLQLQALQAWKHDKADDYRKKIDFTSVFIAADVSWGAQLEALGKGHISSVDQACFSKAAFTTHILIALVDAMRDCLLPSIGSDSNLAHQAASLSEEEENKLVKLISVSWRIEPLLPNLIGLKLALRNRLSEIAILVQRSIRTKSALGTSQEESYLDLGFLEAVSYATDAFNELSSTPLRKWALLFDELEIAPTDIRKILLNSLRSTDQKILFKLSISPYNNDLSLLDRSTAASSSQDYVPIELWYPRKEDGYPFSQALLLSLLKENGCEDATAEDVFGSSEFDEGRSFSREARSGYAPGTSVHKRFANLAARDATFASYLRSQNIDLNSMHSLPDDKRAGAIRKVTSIAAVREAFRSDTDKMHSDDAATRSRKNPTLYTGASSIFAMAEGNPRWLIGLCTPLVRQYVNSSKMVPKSKQAEAISAATNRFRAFLRTFPYKSAETMGRKGLLNLLDKIGTTFADGVIRKDFVPEPPLTFIVDSTTSEDLLAALGSALDAGAIIYSPPDGDDSKITSLRGKRFRLCYMLAPHYKLPLTLGSSRALSTILREDKHLDLFGGLNG